MTTLCAMQVPAELIPKINTCDCRGGSARLGSSNGIAPSTVVTALSAPTFVSLSVSNALTLACTPSPVRLHHRQVSYSLPIISVFEILILPYVGALTDYTPHRKLVWLVNFALTQASVILIAVMWHDYVWFERG